MVRFSLSPHKSTTIPCLLTLDEYGSYVWPILCSTSASHSERNQGSLKVPRSLVAPIDCSSIAQCWEKYGPLNSQSGAVVRSLPYHSLKTTTSLPLLKPAAECSSPG